MTINEIQGIVNELEVPKKVEVFYDINDIKNAKYSWIVEYWNKLKEKYSDERLIAIIVPKKLTGKVVYFLEQGLIIEGKYIAYHEIALVCTGELSYYDKKKYQIRYIFSRDCTIASFINEETKIFASDIVDKIVDINNNLDDVDKKVDYYVNLIKKLENQTLEFAELEAFCAYKKLIRITNDYKKIGEMVRKYGYVDYLWEKGESVKKRNKEYDVEFKKNFPVAWAEGMTVVLWKKADRRMDNLVYKYHMGILEDCYPYLERMQECNDLYGYSNYVYHMYNIIVSAAKIDKKISDDLIITYNETIDKLKTKIEQNQIDDIFKGKKYDALSMIKDISYIYLGKIIDESDQKKKVYKYSYLKNLDKAEYWLNLYVMQEGSDNTREYDNIMMELANIYEYGTSKIPADENRMLECLKKAVAYGNNSAVKKLAEYYINIESEEKNKWIQLAKENGQKVKDTRSINEKMKESIGVDIAETMEAVGGFADITRILNSAASDIGNIKVGKMETESRIKDIKRSSERSELEHEQYLEGQRVENLQARAKNMKDERKANKAISKELKKKI